MTAPEKPLYLDYAATSPLLPEVKDGMCEIMELSLRNALGNASSLHTIGHHAHELVEESRAKVARLINADPTEIIFTSGGSEANNAVMETFRGKNIAVSAIEHPSVLEAAKARAGNLQILAVDEWGEVIERPESADLVSVMMVNNEIGTLEDIVKLGEEAKNSAKKTYFHTDATQALGKIHIDVKELPIDYLTISAHKIGGPIGVGALYVRKGAPLKPLILGGHQEQGRRAGTTNTAAIYGFGLATDYCWNEWTCKKYQQVRKLRDYLAEQILQKVPFSSLNTPLESSVPHILNMSFQAAEGESIQLYLDAEGIIISTGSACASGSLKPSHVIMATRRDAEVAHSSIRFSLGLETTKSELDYTVNKLKKVVERLQAISTVKTKGKEENDRTS